MASRTVWIVGGLVVAIGAIAYLSHNKAPAGKDAAGTIVEAKRARSDGTNSFNPAPTASTNDASAADAAKAAADADAAKAADAAAAAGSGGTGKLKNSVDKAANAADAANAATGMSSQVQQRRLQESASDSARHSQDKLSNESR
jgi:hypothetical protein